MIEIYHLDIDKKSQTCQTSFLKEELGLQKAAEHDPSSIEHPFLQSSWMRFFHPTGVTGMEDQDEMTGTVV